MERKTSSDGATLSPFLRRPGRAALSNRVGRFEPLAREVTDDGWDIAETPGIARTEIALETPRSVLNKVTSPDIGFDRSINPYRGCEHGCIYCFARPTHGFLGLSAGLDFETRLVARPDAAKVLRRELSRPGYRPAPVAIGTNTDPYQPLEARMKIMRQILEVLEEFRHPVTIVTKGTLIERDADILGRMGAAGLARAAVSVTTLDAALSRKMEPRAPAPERRLQTIRRLADAGCPVSVMVAPVIPGLTDHELESILAAAAESGATGAGWIMLRLPGEVEGLFTEWLAEHEPIRGKGVLARLREMHGGRAYDSRFVHRMRGTGALADLIARRFAVAARRQRLDGKQAPLRTDLFRVPGQGRQLDLF